MICVVHGIYQRRGFSGPRRQIRLSVRLRSSDALARVAAVHTSARQRLRKSVLLSMVYSPRLSMERWGLHLSQRLEPASLWDFVRDSMPCLFQCLVQDLVWHSVQQSVQRSVQHWLGWVSGAILSRLQAFRH